MKCLFIPEGDSYTIELLSESPAERETLIKYWNNDSLAVTCEEWREMSDEAKDSRNGLPYEPDID